MKISTILSEVVHDGRICMEPMAYHSLRSLIFSNIALGLEVEDSEKVHAEQFVLDKVEGAGNQYIFPSDAYSSWGRHNFYRDLNENDVVVNVITIAGPMTRGGGACSYGSLEHRNLMMEAADVPQVKGHILIARTPGGMASTLRDYRMAIDYAHAHGQKVYMLCDGDVASCGAFLGTMCDGIYAVNKDDEIGSLGMYCAFFTQKDGDTHTITQETYHEYYASASKDKNAWYRAAAEGDMSLIEAEVNADLQKLLEQVKQDRPQVADEQLTGKMYRMGDVEGSLVDGFTSLSELAEKVLDESLSPTLSQGDGTEPDPVNPDGDGTGDDENTTKTIEPQNQNIMKTYEKMGKAAGLDAAFEQQADGYVQLTEEQADALEATLESQSNDAEGLVAQQSQNEALTAQVETLTSQLTEAHAQIETLTSDLAAKQKELEEIQTSAASAAAAVQTQHESELSDMQEQLDAARATIASQEATIADQTATIEELNASAGAKVQGGGAPKNNGQGVQAPTYSMEGQYDHSLSPAENRKRIQEYEQKQREYLAHC